jgi:MFS transporter, ACS family, tartrate transporter
LSGAAVAAGIGVINSIGNFAGFAGPFAMGWIKDCIGSYAGQSPLAALGILREGGGPSPEGSVGMERSAVRTGLR